VQLLKRHSGFGIIQPDPVDTHTTSTRRPNPPARSSSRPASSARSAAEAAERTPR